MSNKYTILSRVNKLYIPSSPVIIMSGALAKNNETEKLHIQLKFKNIVDKKIIALKAKIFLYDYIGRPCGELEKLYLDVNAYRDTDFGANIPIPVDDTTVRRFTACIVEVSFGDWSIWINDPALWQSMPEQQTLQIKFGSKTVVDDFKAAFNEKNNFYPLEYEDIWLCSCGAVNNKNETKCHKCSSDIKEMLSADIYELHFNESIKKIKYFFRTNELQKSFEKGLTLSQALASYIKYNNLSTEKLETLKSLLKEKGNVLVGSDDVKQITLGISIFKDNLFQGDKDVEKLISTSTEKINKIEEAEKKRKEEELRRKEEELQRKKEEQKKIRKKTLIVSIFLFALIIIITLTSIIIDSSAKEKKYYDAVEIMNKGDYLSASSIFYDLNDYNDSQFLYDYCNLISNYNFNGLIKKYNLQEFTIPATINGRKVSAVKVKDFEDCTTLKKINLPNSIEAIETGAFENCTALEEIVIPDSIKTIGAYAFINCSSLKKINLPNSIETIETGAFENCTALEEIVIPQKVTIIPISAFFKCSSLKSVTLSDNLKSIYAYSFEYCSSLKTIIIPKNVTVIGLNAFKYCPLETAVFKSTKSWSASNGTKLNIDSISSKDAANYLSSKYSGYTWTRTV